jgi:hypothetical protein
MVDASVYETGSLGPHWRLIRTPRRALQGIMFEPSVGTALPALAGVE